MIQLKYKKIYSGLQLAGCYSIIEKERQLGLAGERKQQESAGIFIKHIIINLLFKIAQPEKVYLGLAIHFHNGIKNQTTNSP